MTYKINGNNITITNHNKFIITRDKGLHYTLIESHVRASFGFHVVVVVLGRLNRHCLENQG